MGSILSHYFASNFTHGKLSLGHDPTFLLSKTFYNKNKESETKEGSKIIFEKKIFISQSKKNKTKNPNPQWKESVLRIYY